MPVNLIVTVADRLIPDGDWFVIWRLDLCVQPKKA